MLLIIREERPIQGENRGRNGHGEYMTETRDDVRIDSLVIHVPKDLLPRSFLSRWNLLTYLSASVHLEPLREAPNERELCSRWKAYYMKMKDSLSDTWFTSYISVSHRIFLSSYEGCDHEGTDYGTEMKERQKETESLWLLTPGLIFYPRILSLTSGG